MSAPHIVVIIGASFGGLPVAHALLKDVLPATGKPYKLILINPSEEFWWKIGAPRAIARPHMIPMEKALLNFLPTFEKYGDKFEFIKGLATAIDPTSKIVSTNTNANVKYDSLVIASGTHFDTDIWSTSRGTEALKSQVQDIHNRLADAESILVAGGGPAGVEISGEFGEEYGNKKEITLLSGGSRLLARLKDERPGKDAQSMLEKMHVKVVHDGVQVKAAEKQGNKTVLTLSNGETKTVDVYINATGDKPNNSFIPKDWLNEKGRVKTDPQTLRVTVPGITGVYAVGTIASYSDGSIMDTKMAYKAVVESVRLDLSGAEPGPRSKGTYKKFTSEMAFVPVGSQGGVILLFGWKLPSFFIKMIKAKDFMIGNAPKLIEGNA